MDMLHFHDTHTQSIENAIRQRWLACYADNATLAELVRVLAYPEFRLTAARRENILQDYLGLVIHCEFVENESHNLPRCRDKDDQKFLELAARCRAHYLITRDKQLLRFARRRPPSLCFAIMTATEVAAVSAISAENGKGQINNGCNSSLTAMM